MAAIPDIADLITMRAIRDLTAGLTTATTGRMTMSSLEEGVTTGDTISTDTHLAMVEGVMGATTEVADSMVVGGSAARVAAVMAEAIDRMITVAFCTNA